MCRTGRRFYYMFLSSSHHKILPTTINSVMIFKMLSSRVFVAIVLVAAWELSYGDDFFYSKGRQKDKVGSSLVCALGGSTISKLL